jgi:signal transduction histidine kinase
MKTLIKKSRSETSIRNVYFVSFILLFLCYLVTLYANRGLRRQAARVEHTNHVIKSLDNLLAKIIDAETGVRGYILTRNIQFLFPYYHTEERADSIYREVNELTEDNTVQQQRLDELKKLINTRFNMLRFHINTFDSNNRVITDSMWKLQYQGKTLMDDIRARIALMEREETRLLGEREERMERITNAITTITIISIILVISLLLFGFITYMNVSRERQKALQNVIEYQEQLNTRIKELDHANIELIRMRSQEKFAVTGRIARTIGHEVRNPLTNIMLATDELKDAIGEKAKDTQYLFDMIARNSGRINQLIFDLLDSTKIAELKFEKTSVAALLDETLEEAADRIALTNIRIIKKYQDQDCMLLVDRARLKIAFLNIITNALEAMYEKGSEIMIGISREDETCTIFFKDDGPGMDSETQSKIFEPYYTTKQKGNGLGLTNTQNIIINHKGDIEVESEEGKGTQFIIKLPLPKT